MPLPVDRLYYFKSAAGREIDLLFEMNDCLYACEVKATQRPGPKDFRNLLDFEDWLNRQIKRFLFYLGDDYKDKDGVTLIPITALFRGT
jgi:hypothetical protein